MKRMTIMGALLHTELKQTVLNLSYHSY